MRPAECLIDDKDRIRREVDDWYDRQAFDR